MAKKKTAKKSRDDAVEKTSSKKSNVRGNSGGGGGRLNLQRAARELMSSLTEGESPEVAVRAFATKVGLTIPDAPTRPTFDELNDVVAKAVLDNLPQLVDGLTSLESAEVVIERILLSNHPENIKRALSCAAVLNKEQKQTKMDLVMQAIGCILLKVHKQDADCQTANIMIGELQEFLDKLKSRSGKNPE